MLYSLQRLLESVGLILWILFIMVSVAVLAAASLMKRAANRLNSHRV